MPLTPEDVRNRRFKTAFRGYDETEVDTFLDEVEVELTRLLGEAETLKQRLAAAQAAPPPPQPVHSEAEEMLRRTLLLAQRTADETVASAQQDAERMTSEARAQATALVQQAQQQAAVATADLERRRQALEQHIEGLRAFEREYRTRLKAYLEAQLRDLDGRGQPAPDPVAGLTPPPMAPIAASTFSVAGVTPAEPPPAIAAGGEDDGATDAATGADAPPGPSSVPGLAPAESGDATSGGLGTSDPEPFDIDDGGSGVPKLAP